MRIQTFEKNLPFDEFFTVIKDIIKPNLKVDVNSYADEFNLLIIGIDDKNQSVIIRCSTDKSIHRTYLSILAIHSNSILAKHNAPKHVKDTPKELGKTLFDAVRNSEVNELNFAFTNLDFKKSIEK